jgi:hypothetical protein
MPNHTQKEQRNEKWLQFLRDYDAANPSSPAAPAPPSAPELPLTPEEEAQAQQAALFQGTFSLATSSPEQASQFNASPFMSNMRQLSDAALSRTRQPGFLARNIGQPMGRFLNMLGGIDEGLFRGSANVAAGAISRLDPRIAKMVEKLGNPKGIAFGEESFRLLTQDPGDLLKKRELNRRLVDLGERAENPKGIEGGPSMAMQVFGSPFNVVGAGGLAKKVPGVLRGVPGAVRALRAPTTAAKAPGIPADVQVLIDKALDYFTSVKEVADIVAKDVALTQAKRVGQFTRLQSELLATEFTKAQAATMPQVGRATAANIPNAPQFVARSVEPAFLARFGDAPQMALLSQKGGKEPLLKILDSGWRSRAEQLGLKFVRSERLGDVYKMTGKPQVTREITGATGVAEPFGSFEQAFGKALGGSINVPSGLGFGFKNPLTNDEMFRLMEHARTFQPAPTDVLNNQRALWTLFRKGEIPQPAMIERLEAMFGEGMARELVRIGRLGPDQFDQVMSAINLPRALVATADMSATARQGRILGNANPKEWKDAFVAGVKAFGNENYAREVEASIIRHPNFDWLRQGGIEITRRTGAGVKLAQREEAFMTDLAQRLPVIGKIVRASERSHVTLLNKLRSDVTFKAVEGWTTAGRSLDNPATLKKWKQYGTWINTATGRGPMPKSLQPFAPTMNALFFSPRFNTSRIYTPVALVRAATNRDPELVRLIADDLLKFTMTNMTILAIADTAFPGVSINYLHPGRSDYLKLKVGPTRIDFWAGHDQYPRLVWRLVSGTETQTGKKLDRTAGDIIGQFLRFKMTPTVSLAYSVLQGRGPFGERLQFGPEVASNTIPLAAQAIWEALQEGAKVHQAPLYGSLSLLEILGVSVNSYTTYNDAIEYASKQVTGKPFDQVVSGADKERILQHPLVQDTKAENERQRGTDPEGPVDARVRDGWRRYRERMDELEADFRGLLFVPGGNPVKGRSLLDGIRNFRNNRAQVFETIFTDDEREYTQQNRESGPILDQFRDQYWSVEAGQYTLDDGTRLYDFDVQEAGRTSVLEDAKAAGVDLASVTQRSPNRFADPVVSHWILQYEDDMEVLRPYFDLPKLVIDDPALFTIYQSQASESTWPLSLKRLSRQIDRDRQEMRRRRDDVEQLLLKYGFVTKSIRGR